MGTVKRNKKKKNLEKNGLLLPWISIFTRTSTYLGKKINRTSNKIKQVTKQNKKN